MKKLLRMLYSIATAVFSRRFIIILLIIWQIAFIIGSILILGENYYILYIISSVLSVIFALYIVNRDEPPAFKIAWIIPMLLFPVFMVFFYVYFSFQTSAQLIKKSHRAIMENTRDVFERPERLMNSLRADVPKLENYCRYMMDHGGYAPCPNSSAEYYPSGEAVFPDIKEALERAEKFIFIEFFIINEGKMWGEILEILKRKAAAGIDIRLIYDGFGSQLSLPAGYHKKLRAIGIKTHVFGRFTPFLSSSQNNRDHRKIIVVDGKVAFTGGFNLADEYINQKLRFGYWKDGAVRIVGDAVYNFTVMFLRMWGFVAREEIDCAAFKAERSPVKCREESFILPFGDSPVDDEPVGQLTYLNIINNARDYVYISTPYLTLDSELNTALKYAAKSGVKVRILMPSIPDKKYMRVMAHSQYKQLLDNGVEIYEFDKGFVHEKLFIADDEVAVSGSINMDYRSLYLHFECGAFMFRQDCIADMKRDYNEIITKHSTKITKEFCDNISLPVKIAGAVLNVFASLL